ncbi:apolipoprotein L6-like [Sardina pilchardus]|uniref:apolipoprotein L6-like n=1 Tax=Sardina pilchardus TaxID=27697 RepID=UPI002E12225B
MAVPLVIHFKRDNEAFFLPSLRNVDVLTFHLKKYIGISKQLCERLKKREKYPNVSEDSNGELIQEEFIPDHLDQLGDIKTPRLLVLYRNDPHLRLTFLFQEKAEAFIDEFSQRRTKMEQFLSDLEETEKKLDNMKRGASISNVAGSSVGVAGGICSIVGLALIPVTAGGSLALMTGVGLGLGSGLTSLVTGVTEVLFNKHHGQNVNNIFKNFMEDMQMLIEILEKVADGNINGSEKTVGTDRADNIGAAVKTVRAGGRVIRIGKGIDTLVDDFGQVFKGNPLALSKAARSGFIALNVLFIGLDIFFICKEGRNLSKGSKNELAQTIRSRVDLWRSELESWSRIYESLKIGTKSRKRNQSILNSRFSPNAVFTEEY